MASTKIGTCCYCGTRSTFVLKGKVRHELTCSSCGAPLHALKMLRAEPDRASAPAATPVRQTRKSTHRRPPDHEVRRPKKRRKTKSFGRKVLSEIFDVIEDIID